MDLTYSSPKGGICIRPDCRGTALLCPYEPGRTPTAAVFPGPYPFATASRTTMGRTSIDPYLAEGIFAAIAIASSKSFASIM